MEHEPVQRFEIREATLADAEATRRMQAESWLATYPSDEHGISRRYIQAYTDAWLTPEALAQTNQYMTKVLEDRERFYRVAEDSAGIAGFIHVTPKDDGTKELSAIYTRPDTLGSGLGRQLMEQALEWVGDTPVSLEVAVYNSRAIRFYEKYGFEIVADTEMVWEDMIPVVTMIRKRRDNHEV